MVVKKGRSLFSRNIREEEEKEEGGGGKKERNERIDIFYYIEGKVKIFLLFLFCINRLTEESFHNNEHDYGFENLKAKGCNGDYSFSHCNEYNCDYTLKLGPLFPRITQQVKKKKKRTKENNRFGNSNNNLSS